MTQGELNRLEKAHNLEYDIDILRKAALIVSNSPIRMMDENEKRRVFFAALELVSDRLADLFADEARRLERRFQVL